MKFAQYLKAVDVEAPPPYAGRFLAYKALKKTLTRLHDLAAAETKAEGGDSEGGAAGAGGGGGGSCAPPGGLPPP